MKLPVFEEIETNDYSIGQLYKTFKKASIGEIPSYICIDMDNPKLIEEALDNIKNALDNLDCSKHFPYPFYVVSPILQDYPGLNVVDSIRQLPKHFFKKPKKLKPKEQSLLNKTAILNEKVKNLNITEKLEYIQSQKENQKKLFLLTRETSFYERVMMGIRDRESSDE